MYLSLLLYTAEAVKLFAHERESSPVDSARSMPISPSSGGRPMASALLDGRDSGGKEHAARALAGVVHSSSDNVVFHVETHAGKVYTEYMLTNTFFLSASNV